MEMMIFTVIFTMLNLVLISALLYVYSKTYRQIKAPFTAGLLIFATIFLLQKLVSIYVFLILMHHFEGVLGISMLILEILQTIAFSTLTWITIR